MSSDEDPVALMATFKKDGRQDIKQTTSKPALSVGEDVSNMNEEDDLMEVAPPPPKKRLAIGVRVKPVVHKEEYTFFAARDEVQEILGRHTKRGEVLYDVKFLDGTSKWINYQKLVKTLGGTEALRNYGVPDADSTSEEDTDMRLRNRMAKAKNTDLIDITGIVLSSSEDEDEEDELISTSRPTRPSRRNQTQSRIVNARSSRSRPHFVSSVELSDSEDSGAPVKRRKRKQKQVEPTRRSSRQQAPVQTYGYVEDFEDDEDNSQDVDSDSSASDILRSDLLPGRKRRRLQHSKPSYLPSNGERRSERSTRAMNNMQEASLDDVYRHDDEPKATAPKLTQVREVFETLPRSDIFRSRHAGGCEVCYDGSNVAPLVYCQGCSLAYHKNCLGNRSTREHLVTKVGDEKFVLQCRRCINIYKKKDPNAPDLSRCQDCNKQGASCKPFRQRKTTQQEMKEREENDSQDPITQVASELINNPHNVLFRCTKCSRAWHYYHLPPMSQYAMDVNRDEEELADERYREYSAKFMCKECDDTENLKVGSIIAWRPSDVETYRPGTPCSLVPEDEKQYLIKWENQSYFRAAWFSGPWTWGVTATAMRKAFFKREDGPKMRTEDAIPEEYLRIDIVLDIKFTNYVEIRSEEIDKARIKEVDKALIKYKGLGYEDTVWEEVPTPEDGDRWLDFVTAYNDWVAGRYVKYPKQGPLKARIEKARSTPFAKLEREQQPENLVGGELMKYQIEGLNWLYYQWYSQQNGILADEMGLGKTIQVIAFMATLVQEHSCFPFLIVVPNSTAANWRREIKQWVPSLRVVAYFGSAQARDMAYKYEMFPEGTKDLRCHIVVTSYEAATDSSSRRMFRSVNWAGLIVDEGQRLKNDASQLYNALVGVKSSFRLLMTGTPLQNNIRELFNLLQFLDETINAEQLEERYAEMNSESVKELHDQIRPFILRRTKAQVLGFLPPLGQIILPVSMSHLQKTLYKSILSKSPELLKALFTSAKTLKTQERANLSNILMQLRKCLCHPFVYSREIEERTDIAAVSHRNLVEASAKLSLLELLLPKLKERGHRVLIFSQFLDMLSIVEDFLDGMEMAYQRLDGRMGSLEKQKRIDQFNAPDSPLFAFLLSTRAGGVGINLATADTVIILDPDWNPHQDIQAIARAHRIGQKKKVLCFQLLTRASVEEKIVQMGRTKMALDHVVVEQLDAEDMAEHDVESILKFGAAELFKDESADQDIRYDEESIEKLLDRSHIENTKANTDDDSAEAQFSFARVWANDKGTLQNDLDTPEEEVAPDPGVWDKILKERQAAAAAEALARAEAMGRGRRARGQVDYNTENGGVDNSATTQDAFEDLLPSPVKPPTTKRKKRNDSESDTDFQADTEDESDEEPERGSDDGIVERQPETTKSFIVPSHKPHAPAPPTILPSSQPRPPQAGANLPPSKSAKPVPMGLDGTVTSKSRRADGTLAVKPFQRVQLPVRSPLEPSYGAYSSHACIACNKIHPQGACELKAAGVEHCGLCGLAHFGQGRTCPHIRSETQVREMLLALKNSPEKKELVDLAMKYLRGVKGTLVQQKKRDKEKAAIANGQQTPPTAQSVSHQVGNEPWGHTNKHHGPNAGPSSARPRPTQVWNGPPRRDVPNWYSGGSFDSSPLNSQNAAHQPAQQHERSLQQRIAQLQAHTGQANQEEEMANALRGYLGS